MIKKKLVGSSEPRFATICNAIYFIDSDKPKRDRFKVNNNSRILNNLNKMYDEFKKGNNS